MSDVHQMTGWSRLTRLQLLALCHDLDTLLGEAVAKQLNAEAHFRLLAATVEAAVTDQQRLRLAWQSARRGRWQTRQALAEYDDDGFYIDNDQPSHYRSIVDVELPDEPPTRQCSDCGCTDDHACPGGCAWAAPSLCSSCAAEPDLP